MGLFFAKQYIAFYPSEVKDTKMASSRSKLEEDWQKANESDVKPEPSKDPLDKMNESPIEPTELPWST